MTFRRRRRVTYCEHDRELDACPYCHIAELEAKLAEFICDGTCDPETCRSCRADYAERLEQENARLRDSIKGYMEAKERQWPTKEFSLALGPKRELDKLLNGEV